VATGTAETPSPVARPTPDGSDAADSRTAPPNIRTLDDVRSDLGIVRIARARAEFDEFGRRAADRLADDVEPLLRECAELREERAAARDEARTWREEAIARSDMARAVEQQLADARAQLAEANRVLRAVGLIHIWTNEEGRRFLFADDLASALGLNV